MNGSTAHLLLERGDTLSPYDFDHVWNRKNTHSIKWDGVESLFGDADLLPMWVADMDFKAPQPVIDALKRRAEHGIFGYTLRPPSYDEAVITWFDKRHRFRIEKEWLVFSPGIVPALNMMVQTFTEPGDRVIIQPPVYYPFFQIVKRNGRNLVENPLAFDGHRYTIDFRDLEQKAASGAKMLILCSPHNPVGRVWTRDELCKLGEICVKHDILVIADEIHCDLVRKRFRHIPFASLTEEFAHQSITCTAPSKTFNLAGLQASHLIIPNKRLRSRFKTMLHTYSLEMSNSFAVSAVEAAYRHGEAWLNELLDYIEGNIHFLMEFAKQHLPQVKVIEPEGTYLIWLDFRSLGLSGHELKRLMRQKAKVALNEGSLFGTGGEGFARINIACPRRTLEEGLHRITKALKTYSDGR